MLRKTIYGIPFFRRTISKIPMRISLPLLFTAPVIGVVIVLSAIAFLAAQSTVNDLMEQNLGQIQDRIEERLAHLNALLVEDTGDDRFMTMLLMTVDAKRKVMCWATAGHDPPIVYDPATDLFNEISGSGMSLGVVKGVVYEEQLFTDVQPDKFKVVKSV